MPNHVHLVIQLLPGRELSEVMHKLKSYTAKEANRSLHRSGTFWQREYHDRLVRSGKLERAIEYVMRNPERAGLLNWPWVGAE
jgi:REP element-mobilizing transposase RayT